MTTKDAEFMQIIGDEAIYQLDKMLQVALGITQITVFRQPGISPEVSRVSLVAQFLDALKKEQGEAAVMCMAARAIERLAKLTLEDQS